MSNTSKKTKSSTLKIQPDLNIELTHEDKKEVDKLSTNIKVTIQVTSVDFHPTIILFQL